jgi:ABC-2 type transport system ATP-binding protein
VSIIQTERLTRRYGSRRGVEDVSLSVPEGVLQGFLGPNGAGKTTTIRVLLGFLRPTSGGATIFGLDCWRQGRRIKEEVGYVPGDLRLHSWMNGRQALSIFGKIRRRDLTSSGATLADEFALDLGVRVRNMSRGMRQKLGLILAMAHNPRLLVLDEPTTALDPLMQERLRERLKKMAAGGATVFFSSHSLSEVEQLCERVAIVRDGKLVAAQTLEGLREQAGHEVMIRWGPGALESAMGPLVAPPWLVVHRRDGALWECMLSGPVSGLVAWLAGKPVDDLSITRPDLESLFRQYYAQERAGGTGAGAPAPGGKS